eukprot:gnl/TRDRNA2_/TRDRNA2_182883_c0_seq1.p1 gnl/TRDRNA2_/TRDRNA2_182883_c0~~gnl/TRDRNA2_/TRDRNA2_182883_c0_seq1.p1  ORF type:complete len:120 (+),score=17.25 gnl/TRDRNA2_/TRDRNA2_182883_c0_seq1:73-432(+)
MGLLRAATRLATCGARTAASRAVAIPSVAQTQMSPSAMLGRRAFAHRSLVRCGHNLEDHYDLAEYVVKMSNPFSEYLLWIATFSTVILIFGPLMHSNYYFTGRFAPKDQGNTQLCDDSW